MLLRDRNPVFALRIFPGSGKTEVSLLLTILSLGTRVVLAYACAPLFGVGAIWTAIPISWAMADAAGIILLRRGERTNRMNEIM